MIRTMSRSQNIQIPGTPPIPNLRFRLFLGPEDYPKITEVLQRSLDADGIDRIVKEEDIINFYEHMPNFNPLEDVVLVDVNGNVIGYTLTNWVENFDGTLLYRQRAYIVPEWRRRGIGTALLRYGENRLALIAESHPIGKPKFYASGTDNSETGKIALLEKAGYKPERIFIEMIRDLKETLPDAPLPEGLEIRPVKPEHYRPIWEAMNEAFRDHWGHREATEDDYDWWISGREFQPKLWKVAWDGDQVAGTVLNFIDEDENQAYNRKRGFTEDICVRRPWRRQGLARALLVKSFEELIHQGMLEASLGVDTDNTSGALLLYRSVGFKIDRKYTVFWKPIDDVTNES